MKAGVRYFGHFAFKTQKIIRKKEFVQRSWGGNSSVDSIKVTLSLRQEQEEFTLTSGLPLEVC